jgi:hypothetical protein
MLKFGTVFGHIKTSNEKKNWIFLRCLTLLITAALAGRTLPPRLGGFHLGAKIEPIGTFRRQKRILFFFAAKSTSRQF